MAEFTAADVARLRETTGAGLMDCKKALVESQGAFETAVDILRKRGSASAAKKASRKTSEGVIAQFITPGAKAGLLVEVNCETDFVARNESFRAFCDDIARKILNGATPESLEPERVAAVARIGENIQIPRFTRFEVSNQGIVAAYIHTGAKVGVLVEVGAGKEATVATEEFKQVVRDITLQIAAGNPLVISREEVEQVKNKPPQAIAKIVEGKLEKFFQGICLVDQGFVKRNSEVSVKEHIGAVAKQLGDEIVVRRFARFQVGESPVAE